MRDTARSPVNSPGTWDAVASGYADFFMQHLSRYAHDALRWADVGGDARVLDVATGPGTLALPASRVARVDALDFSADMLEQLRQRADADQLANLTLHQGDGQALPFEDDTFGVAFSMFGLFMFPDRAKGFAELARVVRPSGRAVVASWQPHDAVSMLRIVNAEVIAALGAPPNPHGQPLADPDMFHTEMTSAGFDVEVRAFTHTFETPSLDALWDGLCRSCVALPIARSGLSPERYQALLSHIKQRLLETLGAGPQEVRMPAWIGLGRL